MYTNKSDHDDFIPLSTVPVVVRNAEQVLYRPHKDQIFLPLHVEDPFSEKDSIVDYVYKVGRGDFPEYSLTTQDGTKTSLSPYDLLVQMSKRKDLEEDVPKYSQRVEIHEKAHYIAISGGKIGTVKKEVFHVANFVDSVDKQKRNNPGGDYVTNNSYLVQTLQHGIYGLLEADAIMHQVLGQQYITNVENFSFDSFSLYLANMLANYKKHQYHTETPFIEKFISQAVKYKGYLPMKEHGLGVLILIFGDKIFSQEEGQIFDFSAVIDEDQQQLSLEDQSKMIAGTILKAIQNVIDDPQKFAESLVDSDLKSSLTDKLEESQITMVGELIKLRELDPRYFPPGVTTERLIEMETQLREARRSKKTQPDVESG